MILSKKVWQTWKHPFPPAPLKRCIESFHRLNPDWEIELVTDEGVRELIAGEYPELEETISRYPGGVYLADIWRCLVLHRYGGVYADIDVECVRPLDELLAAIEADPELDSEAELFICRDHPVHEQRHYRGRAMHMNYFMIAKPGALFFEKYIEYLVERAKDGPVTGYPGAVEMTGPGCFSDIVEAAGGPEELKVCLLPWEWLSPLPNMALGGDFEGKEEYDRMLRAGDWSWEMNPFVAHYWWHNYGQRRCILSEYGDTVFQRDGLIASQALERLLPEDEGAEMTGRAIAAFADLPVRRYRRLGNGEDAGEFEGIMREALRYLPWEEGEEGIGLVYLALKGLSGEEIGRVLRELGEILGGAGGANAEARRSRSERGDLNGGGVGRGAGVWNGKENGMGIFEEKGRGFEGADFGERMQESQKSGSPRSLRDLRASALVSGLATMPQGHLMPRGMVYLPETGKGAVTAAVREMLVAAGLEIVGEGPGLLAEVPDGSGRVLVPKVIHQTWKTAEIPHDIFRREWVDSWLEVNGPDGWEVRLWTDRDLEELVMGDYPDFADCYLDYDEAIKRVDAARYLILKRFGGVYADLDFACLKPLDSLLKGRRLLFGSERDNIHLNDSICNAFMASVPGHRFWDHIEDDLRMHAKSGVLSATGPRFLSRRYQNAAAFLPEGDWPLIALRESLYPFRFDSWERDEAREMSLEELKERYPRSHAVSFWTATWMPKGEEAEEEAGAFEEEIDPEVKYFKEDGGDHYDARFFRGMLGPEEKKERLLKLLSSFCGKCEEQGIKPVLMHGGLIGWSHNGRMLPWDDDVDLCVFLSDLYALDAAKKEFSDEDYLLDVNPNFVSRETQNRHHRELFEPNRIDARYVERASGVYLDLTALHAARKGEFRTKCPHVYRSEDLFPLQAAELEGVPLFVPAKVEAVLVAEYGARVLEKGEFNGYRFCEEREEWVKDGIDEEAFVRVAAATLR